MNNVILFMWLGDVAGNASRVLGPALITCVFASGLTLVVAAMWASDHVKSGEESAFMLRIAKRLLWQLFFVIPALTLLLILPSKDTMRLGAALSAGKVVLDSPIGQKAGDAANAILDRIIREAGGSMEEKK